jgi:hypothetical protein
VIPESSCSQGDLKASLVNADATGKLNLCVTDCWVLLQAGFHRDHSSVEAGKDRSRLRRVSRSVEPFRVHALAFSDHAAVSHEALFQAMIHPAEMHQLVDTAREGKQLIEGVVLGGFEDLEISALTPHGIMGEWSTPLAGL